MKNWQKKLLLSTALLGAVAPLVGTTTVVNAQSRLRTDSNGTYLNLISGDNLHNIGQRYNVSVNTLRTLNGLSSSQDTSLQIGQKIYINKNGSSTTFRKGISEKERESRLNSLKQTFRENTAIVYAGNAEGSFYWTKNYYPLPLIIELKSNHPNYEYYVNRGMFKTIGRQKRVFTYLQFYKDSYYYYSPVIRYKDNNYRNYVNNTQTIVSREINHRIRAIGDGKFVPTHNRIEQDVRANSVYVPSNYSDNSEKKLLSGTGLSGRLGTMNVISRGMNQLNWDATRGADGLFQYGQHNFRRYTATPMYKSVWSPANTRLTSSTPRHVDSYQRNRANGNTTTRWGEYRYLGYYGTGHAYFNPYFPVDGMRPNGSTGIGDYPFREFPWIQDDNYGVDYHSTIDELTFQWAMHNGWYGLSPNGSNSRIYNRYYNSSTNWMDAENAYEDKMLAMWNLYSNSPGIQTNMRRARHGGVSGGAAVRALTVKYASLRSDPLGIDDVVTADFERADIAANGNRYAITLQVPANNTGSNPQFHDTQIVEQKVYRGNTLLQTFRRDNNGSTSVTNGPGQGSSAPKVEPGQELRVETKVRIKNAFRDAMHGELKFKTNVTNPKTLYLPNKGNVRGGVDNIFTETVTVPNVDSDRPMHVDTELDKEKYVSTSDMYFHSTGNKARNTLEIQADKGHFEARRVQLVDENGRVVDNPIPGHRYKMRYRFTYYGHGDKDGSQSTKIRAHYTIGRKMVGNPIHGEDTMSGRSSWRTINPQHTRTYTFDTPYYVYETGQIRTGGGLSVSQARYNLYPSATNAEAEWKGHYDLSVGNVRVVPGQTINTQDQMAEMLVQFDVDYSVPNFINNLGQDVDILVDLEGKTIRVNEHIRKGMNRNISVPIEIPLEGNIDKTLEARVLVNPDRNVYESDVYDSVQENNIGIGTGVVKNSTISSFTDNNRRQTWTQYVHENNWYGQRISYSPFSGYSTRSFTRHTTSDNPRATSRYNLYENYEIDEVRFRSRLTKQKNMGVDGWVNLMEEDGYIKAGYGYELEIDVSYDTNALNEEFINFTSLNGPGRWTRPQLTKPLLQDNIYVQMQDGNIRSVVGDGGTESRLRLKEKTENNGRTTWTFEIDGGEVLGAPTLGRFYIGEDVKDGRYPLTVFTPKIRGVNGKQISETNALEYLLYDSAVDLGIVVDGAASDDITDHINR